MPCRRDVAACNAVLGVISCQSGLGDLGHILNARSGIISIWKFLREWGMVQITDTAKEKLQEILKKQSGKNLRIVVQGIG